MLPKIDDSNIKALKEDVHTTDNERASWSDLLSAVRRMERDSSKWGKQQWRDASRIVPPNYDPTFAIAIQAKTRSWDTMQDIKKPYATSTICLIVEMAAALGLHWHQYRAEGNGLFFPETMQITWVFCLPLKQLGYRNLKRVDLFHEMR